MKFYRILDNARAAQRILAFALAGSFALNLLLLGGWYHSQSKVEIHLPPQIPVTGLTLRAGTYPKAMIYSFAFYVWQQLNHWPNDGTKDYQAAIQQFSPFLTPSFKATLIRDYNLRYSQGEIQDRLRNLQGLDGSAFAETQVTAIGHHTWIVQLPMRLTESMRDNGNTVKDIAINYSLRVVAYNTDSKGNPWGLALDGLTENPVRTKTYI